MRYESSVTPVSWSPFRAIDGVLHHGMGAGVGRVTACGYGDGGCLTGAHTVRLGGAVQPRMVPSMVAWGVSRMPAG